MICNLCKSENTKIEYHGYIRDGKVGTRTQDEVNVYRCLDCGCIFHNSGRNLKEFYESDEYRDAMGESSDADVFDLLHDRESLAKFMYTSIPVFRNRIVADVGCGGGAFLDYIAGAAKEVVAIEPTLAFRRSMEKKGYHTYAYAKDAMEKYSGGIDVITSFDVIEHVDDPAEFLRDYYALLKEGGKGFCGTPTEAPFMRKLIGHDYDEKLLFSTQHIWIFDEKSMVFMAEQAGFSKIKVSYYQRYGIGNMISWLSFREPKGHVDYGWIPKTLDSAFVSSLIDNKQADYIVLEVEK